jgi:hypothetical protein
MADMATAAVAGSWASSATAPPATSASSARPSQTSRCARTAEYPLEYSRTAAPVRRLRTADALRRAARRGLRVPAVPCRRYRLGAVGTQSAEGYRRLTLWRAPSRALRGVWRAGQLRRARGHLRRQHHLQRQRRRLDPRQHSGVRALPSTLSASAAALLGETFTAYNLAYTWAAALLLCGFLRSWLFSLREHNRNVVNSPPAGSCVSPATAPPATSASSAQPSQTSRCARTAEYPLEYSRTAAPVRRLRTARAAPQQVNAVPHGVGCEYPKYPTGVTASARSTRSAVGYHRPTRYAGAAASFARRVVCRPISVGL